MSRYPRKELPPGFAVREFSDHTWQAYRVDNPTVKSPVYSRRLKAVDWCYLQVAYHNFTGVWPVSAS